MKARQWAVPTYGQRRPREQRLAWTYVAVAAAECADVAVRGVDSLWGQLFVWLGA